MRVAKRGSIEGNVRRSLTRKGLHELMKELARSAPRRKPCRVFFVGGGTAVLEGRRTSTIDVDLCADKDEIFHDVQAIKERRLSRWFAPIPRCFNAPAHRLSLTNSDERWSRLCRR